MRNNKLLYTLCFIMCIVLLFSSCGGSSGVSRPNDRFIEEDTEFTEPPVITGTEISEWLTEPTTAESFPPLITGTKFSGNLDYDRKLIERTYIAPQSGTYHFDFKLTSNANARFKFSITDSTNELIAEEYGICNAKGLTTDLKKGEQYTFHFEQQTEYSTFDMEIGVPHAVIALTEDTIKDGITYRDQNNHYTYTAPKSGKFRFECDPSNYIASYYLSVTDTTGVDLCNKRLSEKNGQTVTLEAGHTYNIVISQDGDIYEYDYTLTIFKPTSPRTVTNQKMQGELSFIEQENIYYFTIPSNGKYKFSVETSNANASFRLLVEAENQKKYIESGSVRNEFTREVELPAGKYIAHITQQDLTCSYTVQFERI